MKQRIKLAERWCTIPTAMDEPTNGMDPRGRGEVSWSATSGTTKACA